MVVYSPSASHSVSADAGDAADFLEDVVVEEIVDSPDDFREIITRGKDCCLRRGPVEAASLPATKYSCCRKGSCIDASLVWSETAVQSHRCESLALTLRECGFPAVQMVLNSFSSIRQLRHWVFACDVTLQKICRCPLFPSREGRAGQRIQAGCSQSWTAAESHGSSKTFGRLNRLAGVGGACKGAVQCTTDYGICRTSKSEVRLVLLRRGEARERGSRLLLAARDGVVVELKEWNVSSAFCRRIRVRLRRGERSAGVCGQWRCVRTGRSEKSHDDLVSRMLRLRGDGG